MEFEERQLIDYAEPISETELVMGKTYFAVQFIDDEMLIPAVEPIVYLGRNLYKEDADRHHFQDAESYRDGVRIEDDSVPQYACFYTQNSSNLNHVFSFEKALEVLMKCSQRRSN